MMGVGLQPLEFTECLTDSPQFRDNLHKHEKELERTSQQIKRLIKEVKDIVQAAKRLSAAQLALATSMEQFEFDGIGHSMTEDELVISRSLEHFARLIRTIEEERERMLGNAHERIIEPLERFRKEHIGAVKEGKKKFDKKTVKFCQTQERTLSLSTKKPDSVFQEADAAMDMAERDFCQASLEYVFLLQSVQERKNFELAETLLGFVYGWWTFYHQAHDVHADAEPYVKDLQLRIQRTRSNFEETSKQTESLMKKMMEMRQANKVDEGGGGGGGGGGEEGGGGRAGYLLLQERKAFGSAWSKQYAVYCGAARTLALTPYNPLARAAAGEPAVLPLGAARAADAERRFCWEASAEGRGAEPLLLQALGERDRAAWLRAVDAARRGRLRLRAPLHRRHRGARPRRAGPLQGGGRVVEGAAAGGAGGRGRGAGRAGRAGRARDGVAHAGVGAEGLPARAARAAADERAAPRVRGRRQAGVARAAAERRGRAAAGAAGAQRAAAAAAAGAPARGGGAQRPQPHVGLQPGRVLRPHAAAAAPRDRRLHHGPQVLQRARRDAHRARAPAAADAAAAAAALLPPPAQRARARERRAGRPPRAPLRPPPPPHHGGHRGARSERRVPLLAAAPAPAAAVVAAAAAAGRAAARHAHGAAGGRALQLRQRRVRRLRLRLRLRLRRRPAARAAPAAPSAPARPLRPLRPPAAPPSALHTGAHAVRVPGRGRGRAVVRAEPDRDERGAVGGARLAARLAQRPLRPRARELRRAAALSLLVHSSTRPLVHSSTR